ncbi:ATP-dependent DNA ligase [Citricoccus sp.]|uniref:ATP-dependent DNA ligase n=1 Tax=Citricoccus sp. TaxID=1978372 RepID=UPI0028BD33B4|nr:ATP-dependent DNA ligase [Citricoccus sp.]
MARSARQTYTVGEHQLSVSSLDKVLYPATGTTKAEVMQYFLAVADVLIPQVAHRPVTRKRWVDGVGTAEQPGQVFFRKDLEDSAPSWIPTGRIEHSDHTNTYPLANEPAVLAWFAQVAALELHTPQWRFGRNGQPRNPDRLVLDLDPGEGVGLADCAEVARWCRDILADMGMESFPVTSGSKGIHLYAALDGQHNADAISAVAHELARALEADHPDEVISSMRKASRAGKVFVDWSQNNRSKTTVAPYSLRGRDRPWVAAPRSWAELDDPDLKHLELGEVLERVADGQDPLASLGWVPDGVGASSAGTGAASDRLEKYRSMRDATKTAEPVPEETPAERQLGKDERPTFVIQEHHARRLHWDFRLEHSGVLVSWAVPKGPPLDTETNRLAVQTEDHPLEYGTFEGTIAKGEYGAGEVTIWDAGTIEIEKWREGKEVIAVLSGRPDGGLGGVQRRYALINALGMGGEDNWLLHLMQDQPEANPTPPASEATGEPAGKPAAKPARKPAEEATGKSAAKGSEDFAFTVADLPAPMLATAGQPSDLTADEDWSYEMKWDGYRLLAGVSPGQVVLASRNGKDLTADYPSLQELTELLTGPAEEYGGAVLDGEVVALDGQGRPDFGLLQEVSGRTSRGMRRQDRSSRTGRARQTDGATVDAEDIELRYLVFDVLQLGPPGGSGRHVRSLLRTPYGERREILEAGVGNGDVVSVPPGYRGTLARAQRASRDLGLEGVVAKRTDSLYLPGRRGSAWIKLKLQQHQEVVVIGAREGRGGRSGGIGSLLVAVPDEEGELRYAGRVGTGFSATQLAETESRLRRLHRKTPPVPDVPAGGRSDAWWVTPSLVGEVSLAGRTRSGRVRQASWRGWREDKSPDEVRWEIP